MTAKIVVVGSFNADLTTYLERMPRPGETVNGDTFVTGPGGKGSNQAVAAARLGAEVTFIGRVGDDVNSKIAYDLWQEEGINTDYVVQDPDHATGVAPIFVDAEGENMIVVVLGANNRLQPSDIDAAKEIIAEVDVLITQLEINYDIVEYALKVAKEAGIITILNPAPAGEISRDVLELADYITPNETELEALSGKSIKNAIEGARSLLVSDEQTIIVTMGSEGAQFVRQDADELIPIYNVDVVDTTGAGDAFNGGLAVALAEGKPIQEALVFANATAALAVTKNGASASMPTRAEVDELISS